MKSPCLLGGCLLILAAFIEIVQPICVLESDFGFKINCAFKKSGLFRVRNLGGLKAHASIGFSLGDELGFEQSLTNLDPSRRRSVSVKDGAPPNALVTNTRPIKQEKRGKQNRIMRPAAPVNRPNQDAMDKLTSLHRKVSSTMIPIVVETPVAPTKPIPAVTMAKSMPMGVPPFRPLPPKEEQLAVIPIQASRKTYTPLQVPQSKGPGLAYQSEIYPQSYNQVSKMVSQMTAQQFSPVKFTRAPFVTNPKFSSITTINPFVPMPPTQAITIIQPPIHVPPNYSVPKIPSLPNSISIQKNPISNFVDPVPHQVHDIAVYNTKKVDDYNSITGYGDDTVLKLNKEDINTKIAEIAKAGNISMEAVEAAIALRQQQLLSKYANIPAPTTKPTTTTTSTSEQPFVFQPEPEPEILTAALPQKPKRVPTSGKVMNAPREYYPVGYEKNFDDHFQSKVELPETNFHCGDQKYFPGLYGDESLGCMVFHVCALTDDGLVMKSFLCPESTLFDQTILKCNWWFYVDCKNTKKLYDTNIPVSKSYQLMKALTFFSSYKKEMQSEGQKSNPEEMDGIKEAITILQNAQPAPQPSAVIATVDNVANDGNSAGSNIQFVTPTPIIDERNRKTTTEDAPVYRGNRNYDITRINKENNNTTAENQNFKLITVKADMHIGRNNSGESNSREKKHRRRMTLKNPNTNVKSTTTSTTQKSSIDSIKIEVNPTDINNLEKQETLTDQIENVNPNQANLAPVRRFYRSSAEKIENVNPNEEYFAPISRLYRSSAEKIENVNPDQANLAPVKRFYRSSAEIENKEMAIINNEKVQIIRPTAQSKLVGQYPTPSAVIAKLDEAILGKVRTKRHATIVAPLNSPKT